MADTRVSVLSARRECRLHQTGIPHGRQHLFALGAQCSKFSMAPSGFSHLFRGPLCARPRFHGTSRSEEHTSELQSLTNLVCRLLLEKKKKKNKNNID